MLLDIDMDIVHRGVVKMWKTVGTLLSYCLLYTDTHNFIGKSTWNGHVI